MTKGDAVARKVFGERLKDMVYLSSLATYPPKQGRGYGSALVQHVVAQVSVVVNGMHFLMNFVGSYGQAEAQGRATWLISSNVANRGFYEFNGFSVVGDIVLGDDNSTWHAPPVITHLVRLDFAFCRGAWC